MKKISVILLAATLVGTALAQTTTSANIVGYTTVEAVGGELTLAAFNFLGDSSTLQDQLK